MPGIMWQRHRIEFLLGFILSINGASYLAGKENIYVEMKTYMEMRHGKQQE